MSYHSLNAYHFKDLKRRVDNILEISKIACKDVDIDEDTHGFTITGTCWLIRGLSESLNGFIHYSLSKYLELLPDGMSEDDKIELKELHDDWDAEFGSNE